MFFVCRVFIPCDFFSHFVMLNVIDTHKTEYNSEVGVK